ncbi:MAG: acetyl-CoA carboxylase, carboxyltransferase subunit beta [Chitinophagaceae bacterium]
MAASCAPIALFTVRYLSSPPDFENFDMRNDEDFEINLTGSNNDLNNQLPAQEQKESGWFKRWRKGITTNTSEKKEMPEGLWSKCPECNYICTTSELEEAKYVCPKCSYHHRIGSQDYFDIIFDEGSQTALFENIRSKDFLGFTDLKPYGKRLEEIHQKASHLKDSMRVAVGTLNGKGLVVACMDFEFIGGSLGSVMGEKFSRAVDYCIEHKLPYLVISKSGGARMMESAFSLMQLAKTSGKLSQLSDAGLLYISMLTDPTFGGISASFGMLGDLNIAEPGALIGFAGPRVIKETIKRDLPEGFQRSEFLLEHGFLDKIIPRTELKEKLYQIISLIEG